MVRLPFAVYRSGDVSSGFNGRVLERPEISDPADELGITELPVADTIFDVVVVAGAGPARLAAAVYAAS